MENENNDYFLASRFKELILKSKDEKLKMESEITETYPTGFLSFDFLNGTVVHATYTNGEKQKYYQIGLQDGSMNMIIGRSGCGKTTHTLQIAGYIVNKFPTSVLYHDDAEGGITDERRKNLTGIPYQLFGKKYIYRNTGITAENFYKRVKMISDIKLANKEKFSYITAHKDINGRPVTKLEPTLYLLDSLSLVMPEKYSDEDELSGQMATTAAAKTNAAIFRRLIPLLKSSNIILLIINHINQKVEINPMMHSKTQVSMLKQGETLPGGNTPIYLANNIIRYDDTTKLKESDGLGIDGSIVDITLVKSRLNKAGKTISLVFNQSTGFDRDLSMLVFLKSKNKVAGAGAYLYIEGHPEHKFSQKKFKEKLMTDSEFNDIVTQAYFEVLPSLIYDPEEESKEYENIQSDVTDKILQSMTEIAC